MNQPGASKTSEQIPATTSDAVSPAVRDPAPRDRLATTEWHISVAEGVVQ